MPSTRRSSASSVIDTAAHGWPLASAAFTYLATIPLEIDSARAICSCESAQSYLSRNSSLILCMAISSAGIPISAQSARG
jgi:hypothetical protein